MTEPTLSRLLLELDRGHVEALMRTALRMKQIQDRKFHAEIILKFQDGKICSGGGFLVKD